MKKIILLFLLFIPSICFGVVYSTRTVCPSGCDYTTLVLWEAGEQNNLVTADSCAVANITTGFTESLGTGNLAINGWTTNATHFIRIYTSGSARHNGMWGQGYYVIVSTDYHGTIRQYAGANDLQIDGLQIESDHATGAIGFEVYSTNGGVLDISNCIIRSLGTGASVGESVGIHLTVSSGTVRMWNNIINNFGHGSLFSSSGASYLRYFVCYNNTYYETGRAYTSNYGSLFLRDGTGKTYAYLKNNLIFSTTKCFNLDVYTTLVSSNDISNDATSASVAFRNQNANFVNTAIKNFQPISTDTTTFQGLNLSTDLDNKLTFTTDASGATRGATWTIGALERQTVVSTRKRRVISNFYQ